MSQTFLQRLKEKQPKKYASLIAANAVGIGVRRIYGVNEGRITDPEKIEEIEGVAKQVWDRFYGKKKAKSGKKC